MKTYIKKILATTVVFGLLMSGVVGVYAMSEEFKNQILKQIQLEENVSDQELALISEELDDISKEDILSSLLEEIEWLEDESLKSELIIQFEEAKKITQGDIFFHAIDNMYESLDIFYEEHFEDWNEEEWYDFEEEKWFILEELEEEKKYVSDETLQTEITDTIVVLKAESDEDVFFDTLDALYEKLDTFYGVEYEDFDDEDFDDEYEDFDWEYDFEDLKEEILEELETERQHIKDETLKVVFATILHSLKNELDEDTFFQVLDALYENDVLEQYYENQWIDILSWEDFLEGDFDFPEEKEMILSDVREEIQEIEDTQLQTEFIAEVEKLESEENPNIFFVTLDALYEKIDSYYESFEDEFENDWEDGYSDEDFEDEQWNDDEYEEDDFDQYEYDGEDDYSNEQENDDEEDFEDE